MPCSVGRGRIRNETNMGRKKKHDETGQSKQGAKMPRKVYERELLKLQSELCLP